jgi:hypothetical protein
MSPRSEREPRSARGCRLEPRSTRDHRREPRPPRQLLLRRQLADAVTAAPCPPAAAAAQIHRRLPPCLRYLAISVLLLPTVNQEEQKQRNKHVRAGQTPFEKKKTDRMKLSWAHIKQDGRTKKKHARAGHSTLRWRGPGR